MKKRFGIIMVLLSSLAMSAHGSQEAIVWKKGQLHIHTLWSDGHDFPETMVSGYKKHNYDFVVITDHDILGQAEDIYMPIATNEGGWPPMATREMFQRLKESVPAELFKERNLGMRTFVRLTPYDDLRKDWEIPGKFLVMPGEEITIWNVGPDQRQVHVNYINLAKTLNPEPGKTAAETLKICSDAVSAAAGKNKVFFMANHPQWVIWDLQPDELLSNPQYRHFELMNGGYGFPPQEGMPSLEQFWDVVNSYRILNKQDILFAAASDDSHFASAEKYGKAAGINAAWVYVGLRPGEEFTHNSVTEALNEGRYYPSTGVEFDSVSFDEKSQTLRVAVKAVPGRKYKIRFNATSVDFDRTTGSITMQHPTKKNRRREVKTYSPEIGKTVLEVSGTVAECKMQPDWLYLRATVISDEKLPEQENIWHDLEPYKKAWTQPVVNKKFAR